MGAKKIKANKGLSKLKNKAKKFARTFSPSGTADVVGDYLLPKKNLNGSKRKKKMVNGRN